MRLNVQVIGNGPDIIILHGLFGSGDNWQSVAKQLSSSYRVHLPDLRNHGQSPHSIEMSYPLMAADIKEYVEQEFLSHVVLVGHSLGGKTAMQFAADYPEFLEKLVVVDIAPKRYPDHHSSIINALLELDLTNTSSRSELDKRLSASISELAVRQFLLKNLKRNDRSGFEWQMNIEGIQANYDALMLAPELRGTIPVPALFIYGQLSSYVSEDDKEMIKQYFPRVEFHSIKAGHWVHAERPDEFLDILTQFLYSK
ncbi:MAG: alpha/beta fold hydrolase [Calditrichaeota bacterium]|nr:alpha/beta fold hydrolase [Calditrichota bacterium]